MAIRVTTVCGPAFAKNGRGRVRTLLPKAPIQGGDELWLAGPDGSFLRVDVDGEPALSLRRRGNETVVCAEPGSTCGCVVSIIEAPAWQLGARRAADPYPGRYGQQIRLRSAASAKPSTKEVWIRVLTGPEEPPTSARQAPPRRAALSQRAPRRRGLR